MKFKCLSIEMLKLLACVTMLLDHIGATVYPSVTLRIIGRVAFPIYCFALCQGFYHTRSKAKYLLRLGICAVVTEPLFDLLFSGGFTWEYQNVLVTLFLGLAMAVLMEKVTVPLLKLPVIAPFYFLAELLHTDYAGAGILTVALFILTQDKQWQLPLQIVGLTLIQLYLDSFPVRVFGISVPIQLFAVGAMVPIAMYSGKKLTRSRVVQWGFYLFYPVHILGLLLFIFIKIYSNLL